jgi:hypothetical protein
VTSRGLRFLGCGEEVMTHNDVLWRDQPMSTTRSRNLKHALDFLCKQLELNKARNLKAQICHRYATTDKAQKEAKQFVRDRRDDFYVVSIKMMEVVGDLRIVAYRDDDDKMDDD